MFLLSLLANFAGWGACFWAGYRFSFHINCAIIPITIGGMASSAVKEGRGNASVLILHNAGHRSADRRNPL